MPQLTEEQARSYLMKLLTAMNRAGGSDLFVSNDFPPSMKVNGNMQGLATQRLTSEVTRALAAPHSAFFASLLTRLFGRATQDYIDFAYDAPALPALGAVRGAESGVSLIQRASLG